MSHLSPDNPVITVIRQDLRELRRDLLALRKEVQEMGASVQQALEVMAKGSGQTLRYLDARMDDLEEVQHKMLASSSAGTETELHEYTQQAAEADSLTKGTGPAPQVTPGAE